MQNLHIVKRPLVNYGWENVVALPVAQSKHTSIFFAEGRIQGQSETYLTPKGIKQAKELHEQLKDVQFDVVFSSPLARAKDTCEIILGGDLSNVVFDPCLMERDLGEMVGKLDNFMTFWHTKKPRTAKGVESIQAMEQRIFPFIDKLIKDYKGKNVLIVTHQGTLFIFENYFGNAPKDGDYMPLRLHGCGYRIYDTVKMKKSKEQGQDSTGTSG